MARILLGVTGGIAAYKALEVARLATVAPVLTDEFERDPLRGSFPGDPVPAHDPISHLELVANADVFLVAPASANTIAKLAAGMADSILTTSFLASAAPRAVAPAMNDRMYTDPATQANLQTLRERGVTVIEPDSGALASRGEHGVGRLPDPERLLAEIETLAGGSGPWDGLRVLVTAGGTREAIDSVRFIGNRSSGRMGLALASAAARRGAEVTLVAANVALETPPGVERVDVESTAELADAVAERFPDSHVLLMAAAVADFRPASAEPGKLAREGGGLELRLDETEDVLARVAAGRGEGQILVGFAAEHGPEAIERARAKLERKAVDAIVFNDVSRPEIGFDSDQNEVTIVERSGEHQVAMAPKRQVAEAILDRVDALRSGVSASS
jgi:phosphopantothenoylcysteine decarboxylase/phosphopantothenate--cysteine ligase